MPREYEVLLKLQKSKFCINIKEFFLTSNNENKIFMNFVFDLYPINLGKYI